MKIQVKDVGKAGRHETGEVSVQELPLLVDVMRVGGVTFSAPVSYDIRLTRKGDDAVLATGSVATRAELNCSRCLEPTTTDIRVDMKTMFEPAADASPLPNDAVVDLTSDDMDRADIDGDAIDLRFPIQEEIISALPFRLLCREDCKGLCPECGANLNETTCDCHSSTIDPRLAVLKGWKP
jgi:uncharacterized protein